MSLALSLEEDTGLIPPLEGLWATFWSHLGHKDVGASQGDLCLIALRLSANYQVVIWVTEEKSVIFVQPGRS